MALVLCFSKQILLGIGQDEEVVGYAVEFITLSIPSFYIQSLFNLDKKWLNSMKLNYVPMCALIVGTAFHLFFCFLFIYIWQMEIKGLAYAYMAYSVCLLLFIEIYQYNIPSIRDAIFFPTKETWMNWLDYIKLAIPSFIISTLT